jgi:hypothetical protein
MGNIQDCCIAHDLEDRKKYKYRPPPTYGGRPPLHPSYENSVIVASILAQEEDRKMEEEFILGSISPRIGYE